MLVISSNLKERAEPRSASPYLVYSPYFKKSLKPMQWAHIDTWRNFHKTHGDRLSGTYYFINKKRGYREALDSDPEDRVEVITNQVSLSEKSWGDMVRESCRRRKLNSNWNDQNK